MNARLVNALLHRPVLVPTQRRGADSPALRMLGEGVDALLVRMHCRHCDGPHEDTADERRLRYARAVALHIVKPRDSSLLKFRRLLGTTFQRAWNEGRIPEVRFFRPLSIPTHRPARSAAASIPARGNQ